MVEASLEERAYVAARLARAAPTAKAARRGTVQRSCAPTGSRAETRRPCDAAHRSSCASTRCDRACRSEGSGRPRGRPARCRSPGSGSPRRGIGTRGSSPHRPVPASRPRSATRRASAARLRPSRHRRATSVRRARRATRSAVSSPGLRPSPSRSERHVPTRPPSCDPGPPPARRSGRRAWRATDGSGAFARRAGSSASTSPRVRRETPCLAARSSWPDPRAARAATQRRRRCRAPYRHAETTGGRPRPPARSPGPSSRPRLPETPRLGPARPGAAHPRRTTR